MRLETRKMLFAAVFAAIITICAQIVVPIGQVQFSLALLGVFMCGAMLDVKYSVISVVVYMLLGVCGIPVFGKLMGGVSVLLGPTGGYIMAYPFMVLCMGMIVKTGKKNYLRYFAAMCISLVICYAFGILWLMIFMGMSFGASFATGVAGFILFDIIKAVVASYLCVVFSGRIKL